MPCLLSREKQTKSEGKGENWTAESKLLLFCVLAIKQRSQVCQLSRGEAAGTERCRYMALRRLLHDAGTRVLLTSPTCEGNTKAMILANLLNVHTCASLAAGSNLAAELLILEVL